MKKFLHEEEFVEVGFVRKAFGYNGAVKIGHQEIFYDDLLESEFVFIEIRGLKVPFKIIEKDTQNDLIMHFDSMNSSEEAQVILGQKVFLLHKDIIHAKEEIKQGDLKDAWEGFEINDVNSKKVFTIQRIEEFPQQLMAIVLKDSNEMYIPLNDEYIVEIDIEARSLFMDLPEGLLNL